ncbi:histidine kinase [Haloprofundus salilacus]|uniref:histidine kinase n=1 Tax=Haloprofundus salilacus TaxID=2876190 RepID=UPI001CCB31B3|nr:histidine kinase [Haloprofundus salilacus]
MSTRTETAAGTASITEHGSWKGGVAAGLVGGAVMGMMLSLMMTPVIEMAIPALWGLSGGLEGWVIHMANSAILGVVFAAIAGVANLGESTGRSAAAGVAYGVVLWVVLAAFVMPIWLGAVGFPEVPPLPNFDPMSLVGHVVYGLVLGAVYPSVRNL